MQFEAILIFTPPPHAVISKSRREEPSQKRGWPSGVSLGSAAGLLFKPLVPPVGFSLTHLCGWLVFAQDLLEICSLYSQWWLSCSGWASTHLRELQEAEIPESSFHLSIKCNFRVWEQTLFLCKCPLMMVTCFWGWEAWTSSCFMTPASHRVATILRAGSHIVSAS